LLGAPSFQLTKGIVSNEHLVFPDGTDLPHVQHTAAIDPGSSGGPLLGPAREVLGVNTFKLVGRENVNVAVPGSAVVRALEGAETAARCDARCRTRLAKDGCLAIATELGRAQPRLASVQRVLGRDLVAAQGIASHDEIARTDDQIFARFKSSPIATLSEAVARRLVMDVGASGGIHPLETCSDLVAGPDVTKATLALGDGHRRAVTLRWESSRWVLADYAFPDAIFEPAPNAKTPKNSPKNRKTKR
jgi:serine protease Do